MDTNDKPTAQDVLGWIRSETEGVDELDDEAMATWLGEHALNLLVLIDEARELIEEMVEAA